MTNTKAERPQLLQYAAVMDKRNAPFLPTVGSSESGETAGTAPRYTIADLPTPYNTLYQHYSKDVSQ